MTHTEHITEGTGQPAPLFDLGFLTMSPGITDALEEHPELHEEIVNCLRRHQTGDYSEMSADDRRANLNAIESGQERILSAYQTTAGKIWIITEWDKSLTNIIFPREY